MDILIKAAAIAVAGTVIALVVKKNSPEMALLLTVALSMTVLYLAFSAITEITGFLRSLASVSGLSPEVLTIVLKTVGVGVISKLASDICRDAGQASVASGIEFTGSVAAVFIALPLFKTVISMIDSLV